MNQQKFISRGKDLNKDQTYFLWQIKKEQINHILFPAGEFNSKQDLRDYATSRGLITSKKPDSQGLCFVGQTSLRDMLLQVLGQKDGYLNTYMTREQVEKIGLKLTKKNSTLQEGGVYKINLGSHKGAFLYTIGQRQNLGISNGPWFVSDINVETNEVTVVHKLFDQDIYTNKLIIKDINWHIEIDSYLQAKTFLSCQCQIRYRNKAVNCTVKKISGDNKYEVAFDESIKAAAIGQSIVFYDDHKMLGGGIINQIIKSV